MGHNTAAFLKESYSIHGLLKPGEGYEHLGDPEKKRFFKDYTIQVGSTGNLGLSIGIISAVL